MFEKVFHLLFLHEELIRHFGRNGSIVLVCFWILFLWCLVIRNTYVYIYKSCFTVVWLRSLYIFPNMKYWFTINRLDTFQPSCILVVIYVIWCDYVIPGFLYTRRIVYSFFVNWFKSWESTNFYEVSDSFLPL